MAEPLSVRPLSVDEYHAMAEAGILSEDARVELIDGQIIEKMTIGPKHSSFSKRNGVALHLLVPQTFRRIRQRGFDGLVAHRCNCNVESQESDRLPSIYTGRIIVCTASRGAKKAAKEGRSAPVTSFRAPYIAVEILATMRE